MVASDSPERAFEAALAVVPRAPGVYFFLDADAALLYVGKAGDLRRRVQQHERADHRPGTRPRDLYQRVREIRWEIAADEASAASREADLIVGLQPAFNASLTGDGRWAYVHVQPAASGDAVRFALVRSSAVEGGRVYGCFPHLGVGVSSVPAIACSEGYSAFLRLMWAASDAPGHHFPRALAGPSPPDGCSIAIAAPLRPALHAFLSGTSRRLLSHLAAGTARRETFMQPGLARDQESASAFFTYGPKALRAVRLRHRLAPGPVARSTIEALLAREVREAIGDFTVLELPDPTQGLLGARASKTVSVGAARRAQR